MTDQKDMGIFGFGKDEDMRIFMLIGVILVVFAAAYLYYTTYNSDVDKTSKDDSYYGVISRNIALIVVATLLVSLIIFLIIAKVKAFYPFTEDKDFVAFKKLFADPKTTDAQASQGIDKLIKAIQSEDYKNTHTDPRVHYHTTVEDDSGNGTPSNSGDGKTL